jgi:histidinol-phosphate aminotransferase
MMLSMAITVREDLAGIPDFVPGRKLPGAVVLASNEVASPRGHRPT